MQAPGSRRTRSAELIEFTIGLRYGLPTSRRSSATRGGYATGDLTLSFPEALMTQPDDQSLRDEAKERMQKLPAETALGNKDPEGGGEGQPADYEGNSDRS